MPHFLPCKYSVNDAKMTAPIWKISLTFDFIRNPELDLVYGDEIEEASQSGNVFKYRKYVEKLEKIEQEPDYSQEEIYEYLWDSCDNLPRFLELADLLFTNNYRTVIGKRAVSLQMIHGQAVLVIIFDTAELVALKSREYSTEEKITHRSFNDIDVYENESKVESEIRDISLEDTFYEGCPGESCLVIPSKYDPDVTLGLLDFRNWKNFDIERVTDLTGEVTYEYVEEGDEEFDTTDEELEEVDLDDAPTPVKKTFGMRSLIPKRIRKLFT